MVDEVWTQAKLDALKAAAAKGQLRISLDGHTIEYRSLDDLLKMIRLIQEHLNAASSTPRPRQWYAYSGGKGI